MLAVLALLLTLLNLVSAQGSAPTSIWATGTLADGATTVTLSPFTQTFRSMYATVATPRQGSIGLGSISGSVGIVRPPRSTEVTVY